MFKGYSKKEMEKIQRVANDCNVSEIVSACVGGAWKLCHGNFESWDTLDEKAIRSIEKVIKSRQYILFDLTDYQEPEDIDWDAALGRYLTKINGWPEQKWSNDYGLVGQHFRHTNHLGLGCYAGDKRLYWVATTRD